MDASRHPSLARRVFVALLAVASSVAVLATVASTLVYQSSLTADAQSQLARESSLVASAMGGSADEVAVLASLDLGDVRTTLVAADGTVLYDNRADASAMENHASRPEVAAALSTGEGSSVRSSETVGYVSLYHAVLLPSGDVLRLSVDRAGVVALLSGDVPLLVGIVAALVVMCWLVSRLLSVRLVAPILAIDPARPSEDSPYTELQQLVDRLDQQQATLVDQMEELRGAEVMRQEFTANVTHELKTPLASISGAAELIRDGIARPEDVPNFAGRICDESARLTSLVNDILTLSKLDESERAGDREPLGSVETCDLLSISRDVADRLARPARDARVSVSVEGTLARVRGQARLLDELVYNLCDNAIRYNRPGGTVSLTTGTRDGAPFVSVADTGIGIPKESQAKVFERFYRVDTSRSRASGGTGLGLAIVKHAAAFHGATISLESDRGAGTTITVTFPAEGAAGRPAASKAP